MCIRARSCVVIRPTAPASTRVRTTASAPSRRSCELVPANSSSSRNSSGRSPRASPTSCRTRSTSAKKRDLPPCSESCTRSVAPTVSGDSRSRRARREIEVALRVEQFDQRQQLFDALGGRLRGRPQRPAQGDEARGAKPLAFQAGEQAVKDGEVVRPPLQRGDDALHPAAQPEG